MKFRLLFITLFICSVALAQNKGTISGVLTDKDSNNATLPFANAMIKGTATGTTTDENGNYAINLNPGDYVIEFSFLGYENVEVPFTIIAGETITINKTLGSGSYKLEDVVIKASSSREKETALLLDQKQAVEIKQSIGAQEMSRKGISDVEEGLTKISGITKVESRGLFVRGLEDRYNNLLINGLQAPSNSPFKKIIPLDLFPTDIVGVLNVYKTFNPNISGDFAGATVNIETAQAKGSLTKLNVGFGYTTNNNGEDFLISSDANTTQGFFGLVGDERKLPAVFGNAPSGRKLTSTESKEAFKDNSWNVDKSSSPINSSIGFLHTEKFNLKNESSVNYLLSLNADNKYTIREGVDRTFNQGQGNYDNNLYKTQYNYQTATSALLGVKYKAKRANIGFNTFYLRSTESRIQDQLGYTNSLTNNPNMLIRLNQFEQSDYFNTQLFGDYSLTEDGKHTIKAGGSFVKTTFQQPDRKFIIGNKVSDTEISTTYGGNNLNRQYLDVKGNYYVSGLLEYNWKFGKEIDGKSNKLSVGYNTFRNDLSSTYRFLSGKPLFQVPFTTTLNTIDTQISSDVENGILAFQEESNADYKVKLNQFVNAGYFNLFWNFGESLEVNAGVRAENSNRVMKYRPISLSIGDPYVKRNDDKLNILPSANIKYELNEKSNIRFAASNTITRPITMELLPNQYVNADGTVESGNKDLKDSENINIDLKYELFPNNKELIAVGLFGKKLKNPIERIFIPTASSGGQITTYQNSKEAILFGAELEFLLQLSRIHQSLSNFSLGLNTSLMKTDVNVDLVQNPLENNSSRKLQGASAWLFNSDLKYDFEFNEIMKNSISLVYGVYGDRIFAVGTAGLDHIYEKQFNKLDFVWSSRISENLDLKFSADNLLNPAYKLELGKESSQPITESSLVLKEYKKGVGFSLNLSYTF
ncbi:TonB-dependent receptor [Flavobacterium sp.]|uniref:TonB-dependent receptor n=1 Tax=Flavobacterium sp. TaxID=239 RepID=UPI002B4B1D31|nr:outer membrane beta-barrel protein [Flavobacterium sp.]HLF50731.1 outer membrane beta-barrel protein [Flavobacterium sp.]